MTQSPPIGLGTKPTPGISCRSGKHGSAVLVARGKGTKQIAAHLYISRHTVRSYMRRMFSKLRVSTRPAMVAQLMKAGVVLTHLAEVDGWNRSREGLSKS